MNFREANRPQMSSKLLGLLYIANSTPVLQAKMLPFISLDQNSVDWELMLKQDFEDRELVAIHWAYSIWFENGAIRDPFTYSHLMNETCAKAVLNALIVSWGLLSVNL